MWKKLDANHRFNKPNKQNQIPIKCINFNFCGKHCYKSKLGFYDEVATDCKVLKGEYCENYRKGIYKNEK